MGINSCTPTLTSSTTNQSTVLSNRPISTDELNLQPLTIDIAHHRIHRASVTAVLSTLATKVHHAHDVANRYVGGWHRPLPSTPPYQEIVQSIPQAKDSLSIGTIRNGRLQNAVSLEYEGVHHSIIETHRLRRTNYGTQELVQLVLLGAQAVNDRYPSSILRVGNLSFKHGGRVRWSSSHQAGRDADLAFYVRNRVSGEHYPTPSLVSIHDDGSVAGHDTLEFDVARNWELVRTLALQTETNIQWLFISEGLKQLLLDHAIQQNEPPELIAKASRILHQPTDAPPHNDHFHLRIGCSKEDRIRGCIDDFPRWQWYDWHYDDMLSLSLQVHDVVSNPLADTQTRVDALNYLKRIHAPHAPEIAFMLARHDSSPQIITAALEIAEIPVRWSALAIRMAFDLVRAPHVSRDQRQVFYERFKSISDELVANFLFEQLLDDTIEFDEKLMAANALRQQILPEMIPTFVEHIQMHPPEIRAELALTLSRITVRPYYSPGMQPDDERHIKFENWWHQNNSGRREEWLKTVFAPFLFKNEDIYSLKQIDKILPLILSDKDYIAYNAHLLMRKITRKWVRWDDDNPAKVHANWSRWWQRNRNRLLSRELPTSWKP